MLRKRVVNIENDSGFEKWRQKWPWRSWERHSRQCGVRDVFQHHAIKKKDERKSCDYLFDQLFFYSFVDTLSKSGKRQQPWG